MTSTQSQPPWYHCGPYKGYTGRARREGDDAVYRGRVRGLPRAITFESGNANGLEKEFQTSVDRYLDLCKKDGVRPEIPCSGLLLLSMTSVLHKQVAALADVEGVTVNEFAVDALEAAVKLRSKPETLEGEDVG
jgi:predicted HicB family RNase H-like nuclease